MTGNDSDLPPNDWKDLLRETEALDTYVEPKKTPNVKAIEEATGVVKNTTPVPDENEKVYEVLNQSGRVVDWGARTKIKNKWRNIYNKKGYSIREADTGSTVDYKDI